MRICVESRGFAQDEDYRWLEVSGGRQQRTEKEDLPAIIKEAGKLIDSEGFSAVLYRHKGELLLLLTGLEKEGRLDFVERQIRISVAWIGEDSEDSERALRALAVRALEEEKLKFLIEEIAGAVTLGGEEGFQADFQALLQLAEKGKAGELLGNEPADTAQKIAQLSPERKRELAEELKQYCLPKQEGALVAVTEIKKEETLISAGVWRGVSSLVRAEGWESLPAQATGGGESSKFLEYLARLAAILGIAALAELFLKPFNIGFDENPSSLGSNNWRKRL